MENKRKFFYIDEDGNKRKYAGKIIDNNDGTFNGVLTSQKFVYSDIKLNYHPAVEHVDGYSSYYTYINDNNETVNYYSIIKTDKDGSTYFTYNTMKEIPIIVHEAETKKNIYYTYTVNDIEHVWTGKIKYENGTYIGI